MKITVTTMDDVIFSLDVSEDLELENFKAFCENETGIPAHEILISHFGRPLTENSSSLKAHGVSDGDVVTLQRMFGSSSTRTSNPVLSSKYYQFEVCKNLLALIATFVSYSPTVKFGLQ